MRMFLGDISVFDFVVKRDAESSPTKRYSAFINYFNSSS